MLVIALMELSAPVADEVLLPVVIDPPPDAIMKACNTQGYPYGLLVDAHGRVVEARLKPQTTTQLKQMLAKAAR